MNYLETLKPLVMKLVGVALKFANNNESVYPQVFLVELNDRQEDHRLMAVDPASVMHWHNKLSPEEVHAKLAEFINPTSSTSKNLQKSGFRVDAIIRIFDSWVVVPQTPAELEKLHAGVLPSEMPTRKEAVIAHILWRGHSVLWPCYRFEGKYVMSEFPTEAEIAKMPS